MVKIVWTDSALDDLDEIAEYIALDKIGAAKKLVQNVFSKVDLLVGQPEMGRTPPELRGESYREIIVGPCRIFYRVLSKEVVILHVMRSEKILRRYILKERGENENKQGKKRTFATLTRPRNSRAPVIKALCVSRRQQMRMNID